MRVRGCRSAPLVVALVTLLACAAVAAARLISVCEGDPGCFVVAGPEFTDPVESGLPVLTASKASGYDGQFFWRLARSPDRLEVEPVHGVRMDSPIRVGRPGYPVLAWLGSLGGRASLTDWALITVNLLGAAVLAGLLAGVAERAGRSAWFGLAAALWPGLLFALGRDLSEVTAATFVVTGLVLLDRRRLVLAGLAWAAAVLTREQSLVVPIAYGLWWVFRGIRRRAEAREAVVFLTPALLFAAWQVTARSVIGEFPVLASSGGHAAFPLSGFLPAVGDWLSGRSGPVGILFVGELVVLALLVGLALRRGSHRWELVPLGLGAALVLSATESVWRAPGHLRFAADLVAVSWFVLLGEAVPAGTSGDTGLRLLALGQVAMAVAAAGYVVRTP